MIFNTKDQKNRLGINSRPIISLLVGLSFFTLILIIAFAEIGKGGQRANKLKHKNPATIESESENSPQHSKGDQNVLGVILDINKDEKIIKIYDITKDEEISLLYTGASSILDKYDQVVSIGKFQVGQIVEADYLSQTMKVIRLQPSHQAWEYVGVNNITIDFEKELIKLGQTNYTYKNPIIVDEDRFIRLEDLAEQDVLTLFGVEETIWSFIVTKGHGWVKLKDYEAFLGGTITVGYEAIQEVSKDMEIIVREGNYNLTIENDEYSGTKNITVERNKETVVSVGDLGPDPTKFGDTTFDIIPFGADLYIDGELTPYASPIKLSHGVHNIEVSLGGYLTYRGELLVDYSSKKIQIVLPEALSRETVSVVESEQEDSQDGVNIEYNDWDSQADSSEDNDIEMDNEREGVDDDPIVDSEHLIYIQNPSGASVYLNGEYKGVSPGSFKKVIGSHVLTFIKKGYKTKSYTIDVADDGLDTYISLPDLILE